MSWVAPFRLRSLCPPTPRHLSEKWVRVDCIWHGDAKVAAGDEQARDGLESEHSLRWREVLKYVFGQERMDAVRSEAEAKPAVIEEVDGWVVCSEPPTRYVARCT